MTKYFLVRVNFSIYPTVNSAFHLMIFHENGSVLLFYCQCHDFKVGQASKSRNWLVDGCWRATRIMTKMRWKSQLGFRSQCGNFKNLRSFFRKNSVKSLHLVLNYTVWRFHELFSCESKIPYCPHCVASSSSNSRPKTFHLYMDTWW